HGFSYAHLLCPSSRPGRGEIHEVDARDHKNKHGNCAKDVQLLDVSRRCNLAGLVGGQMNVQKGLDKKSKSVTVRLELLRGQTHYFFKFRSQVSFRKRIQFLFYRLRVGSRTCSYVGVDKSVRPVIILEVRPGFA